MAEQTALPYSGKIVRSSHVGFNEDGDEDDNQPIAGSTSGGPRGPTPNALELHTYTIQIWSERDSLSGFSVWLVAD